MTVVHGHLVKFRLELLCTEHARDVTSKSDIEDANCVVCELTGDIGEQLFCTSCGLHYHGGCLDPAVEVGDERVRRRTKMTCVMSVRMS